MLKFFRKIRQSLHTGNSTFKYFKYALGEIILVVIGILLAVQINDWNANRIKKQNERIYLSNLTRDITLQVEVINAQIAFEKNLNEIATPIIQYYKDFEAIKVDSAFTVALGILTGRKTFVKKSPTYIELISSGNIEIISDNSLKDAIIIYYEELERLELVINKNNNLFTDEVFIPKALSLAEVQISGEFSAVAPDHYLENSTQSIIDLNEDRLKEISKKILDNPQNELNLINLINYKNFVSINHQNMLQKLSEETKALLEKLGKQ